MLPISIYNSLTNKKEPFVPEKEGEVHLYVCGPTVYNYVHIGNMRPVVVFDTFRRFLTYIGYQVTYVSNYTDVDDKIIKEAKKEGKDEKSLADFYIAAFEEDLKNIHALKPNITPRVTEYMPQIIAFIQELVEKGAAYVVDGDVYFRVSSVEDYGVLSNTKIEDLLVGARIEVGSKKESPLDFTLWKKTEEGIRWDSPWSKGRPGWHTECVVMIHSIFAEGKIDIHGGGFDLKFPHHENEIAQCQACYGHKIAKYWMHNGFININNEKMSKSLGNFVTAKDALAKYSGNVVRLLLLSTYYRSPVNFAEELLMNCANEIQKMQKAYQSLAIDLQIKGFALDEKKEVEEIKPFLLALADDLNTSNAMTELFALVKKANQLVRSKGLEEERKHLWIALRDAVSIMGFVFDYPHLTEEDLALYQSYQEAKAQKDFARSDELRAELMKRNIL